MKYDWKDTTIYSQSDKDRDLQEWSIASLDLSVHRHIDYPGRWLMTARGDDLQRRGLTSRNIKDAKQEALRLLYEIRKTRLARAFDACGQHGVDVEG